MRRQKIVFAAVAVGLLALLGAGIAGMKYIQRGELEIRCARNLGQIHDGLSIYALRNGGQYPPDLETLVKAGLIFEDDLRPIKKLGKFNYIPPVSADVSPDTIIVWEPLSNHSGRGMHVLRFNRKKEWLSAAEALKQIPEMPKR